MTLKTGQDQREEAQIASDDDAETVVDAAGDPADWELVEEVEISDEEAADIFGGMLGEKKNPRRIVERSFADMAVRSVDEESRTVEIAVSSEKTVDRWFGKELLVHTKKAIDTEFLGSGRAPLLLDHNHTKQIGVIESVKLGKDRVLRAKVRFSRSALAQEVFDDIVDGIRSNVSVGYIVHKMERDPSEDELYNVTRWSPLEASIVSVPADTSVGVGRSKGQAPAVIAARGEKEIPPQEKNTMSEQNSGVVTPENTPDLDAIRQEAATAAAERARTEARDNNKAILELASKHGRRDLGDKAIAEGKSIAEFRGELLDAIGTGAPLESNDVGMSAKERRSFSLTRLINAMANPHSRAAQEAAAFEFEASQAAQQKRGYDAQGYTVPTDVLRSWTRDLNTSDDSALLDEDFRGNEFIDVLRNQTSVMRAGARMLTGLEGNVAIPKKTAASSGGWIATEGGASSESEPTFGQVTLSPKVVGAFTDMTRLMMQQSSMDMEALVRDDLAQGLALAIDLGGLEGSGSSGQPTGVLNTAGINTVTNFAAAVPTFAEMVSFETALAEDNALIGNLAYITDAATVGGLKTTSKDTGSGMFVLENGQANGYNVYSSQQATAGNVYFGNWSDLLIGMWGGLDILVDPYTASTAGTVRVVALQTVDCAVRHAVSFAQGDDGV